MKKKLTMNAEIKIKWFYERYCWNYQQQQKRKSIAKD